MKFIFTLLVAVTAPSVFSYTITFSKPNVSTAGNLNDELTLFKLDTRNYHLKDHEDRFGTTAYMSYRTDKVENLKKFGIVQFIKGCVFVDPTDSNPNKFPRSILARNYYDEHAPFYHPEWMIDSLDKDPLYNSYDANVDRFAAYKWVPTLGDYTNFREDMYVFDQAPPHAELFVTDRPAQAYANKDIIQNVSLSFKSCIYKIEDIPLESNPTDTSFAKPIKCFEWNSSYIYNKELKKFESPQGIHPFCLKEKVE